MRLTTRLLGILVCAAVCLLINLDARPAFAQQAGAAFAQPIASGPSTAAQPAGSSSAASSAGAQPGNTPSTTADIERQLLDKINELEKRVAELEARSTSTPSAAPSVPLAANSAAATSPVGSAPPPASVTTVAMNGAQSTDNGKPAKAPAVAPFSDADWTWLNGNPRTKDIYWDTKFFTPEIRADTVLRLRLQPAHRPLHRRFERAVSLAGSSADATRRRRRLPLRQRSRPPDDAVRRCIPSPRRATMPAPAHGQWDLADAYRYVSEAYGGYHFNVMHGINVDAGIFMSYIGLFSYYNFDNWAYQPSYVSSNTPWFFNGVRVQIFPTKHLKIEPWFINGWQSYASANHTPGVGGQIKWTPTSFDQHHLE